MKKLLIFILIVLFAPLLAALYGVLHDQFTYTISPEYYTKFKFIQFELVENKQEAIISNQRVFVAAVGAMATWWMGIPIGIILALVGLIHREWREMLNVTLHAFALTIVVAFLTGLIGLGYGYYSFASDPGYFTSGWYLPKNLVDVRDFVAVGSMHNFSYIGGAMGLLAAIYFSVRRKWNGGY